MACNMNTKSVNNGLNQHRFSNNPLEKKFYEKWEKENNNGHGILEYILKQDPSSKYLAIVSDRDRVVAATVIQWLGSPVGQAFLESVAK